MSIWIQVVVREWLMLMETFNLEVELGRKVRVNEDFMGNYIVVPEPSKYQPSGKNF